MKFLNSNEFTFIIILIVMSAITYKSEVEHKKETKEKTEEAYQKGLNEPFYQVMGSFNEGDGIYAVDLKDRKGNIFTITLPLAKFSALGIDVDMILEMDSNV